MAVEFGFSQRQLQEDFTESFLEDMIDYQIRKNNRQKNG